ncbi:hypothetical protein B566_EDAN006820, partial [Ephemera danica]
MDDICTQVIEELHTEDGNESSSLQEKVQLGILECEGSTYPLYSGENIIGRDKTCDIIIPPMDGSISRRHALIVAAPNAFFVSDFGSLNGTYIGKDKLEPNVRYHVDEKSDLKIGTVFITVRKATKDEECGSDQSGYDSDTILTEETSGKQVESEETKAVEDDEVATQFDEPEIVEPSVVQDEDENLTDFEESTPEDQEFLDDTETCTKVTTEPNTSPSHRSPPPSDTPAKNILDLETQALPGTSSSLYQEGQAADNILEIETQADDNILNMETQAATGSTSSPFLIPRRPSKTPNILSMETQAADNILNLETQAADNILNLETQADDNILNMETQATPGGSSSSFRTAGRLASKAQNILDMKTQAEDNILNLETQADDNILNMETQATAGATPSPSHTSGRMAHKPPNILNLETQAEENLLNMETQASPGAILSPFSTPGSKVQNILNLETQAEDNILDMETQATPGATPSPFSTPGSKVQTILNLETQAEVNILEMETQASSGTTPSPFRTPGRIACKTSTILVMETQEEEEDVLNMETQAYPGATSSPLNTSTMLDKLDDSLASPAPKPSTKSAAIFVMETQEDSCTDDVAEKSKDAEQSGILDASTSSTEKHAKRSLNDVLSCEALNIQSDATTRNSMSNFEKSTDVPEKNDKIQGTLLESDDSSNDSFIINTPIKQKVDRSEVIKTDATKKETRVNLMKGSFDGEKADDSKVVWATETQDIEDDNADDSFSCTAAVTIPESQDIDDLIEGTPPPSPSNKAQSTSMNNSSMNSDSSHSRSKSFNLVYRDTDESQNDLSVSQIETEPAPNSVEEIPISQIETQIAPTSWEEAAIEQERGKLSPLKTTSSISSPVAAEKSANESDELSTSQIETQIAPTCWEEAADEQERGKLSPPKTTTNIPSPLPDKLEPNVRYHVDEKSDLKIGTVFITVRKATKDEECGSDQSGYDSDTILTEETSGKQVESEETKAVEDDEVATQFDEPEIVEPSVVQDEDENLTDFEESTPEDQEFLDDTETCTKVTTEPNTSPSHHSPPPSDTPAKNILDLETQALPGTSSKLDDSLASPAPKPSTKSAAIFVMETQEDSCTDDVAEKSKDAEQSGILDASTSSTEKHAKRSLNDVLSCEALNIQSDATTRNSMSNFEKSTDVPEKNDKIQGTLLESDDSSNDSFIINTPIKQKVDRSEVIKTDATKKETRVNLMKGSFDGEKADDSKVVWATETQDIEDDNADDSFSCTAAVTIPESQDIDDFIE